MTEPVEIFSADQMRERYGSFYDQSPKLRLDRARVPQQFWPLLPYAEFWGIADDSTREDLIKQASPDVQRNLKEVVAAFDDALEEWLVRPAESTRNPSDEYVAFAAMIMAADYIV